ncbi:MAG: aminotransferase class V-fold PLP-dependent enzyme [Deltaproteobacteria bacterium]|nr:aminotransferase class V-fold PLP-dependent enzyme [Deltaproteobacteria bacterium]
MIYFDNAATSWPKPEETYDAMDRYSRMTGGSPGRSGHRLSIEAGRVILDAREALSRQLGIDDVFQIVFTKNATEALNLAVFGLLSPGDHVITSSMEHNSVMRPLRALEERGVAVSVVMCSPRGELDPQDILSAIQKNTKAVFLTHASNVTGTIMPIREVGKITRDHGIIFCIDAAQTAGVIPIHVDEMNIDLLAFTGHKSLYGPQGTGGLYIRKGLEKEIQPLMVGGTGSRSEFEKQPDFMPDKYESGTPNGVGIAGLGAGAEYIFERGVDNIRARETMLTQHFLDGLKSIGGIHIYGPGDTSRKISVVSFNLDGMTPSEASFALDEQYGIMCRPGLHCAPAAHRTIGTFPGGTVRFSFGYFNTEEEISYALDALQQISRQGQKK